MTCIAIDIRQILGVAELDGCGKATLVELTGIRLPGPMEGAMVRRADAERAGIVSAGGESPSAPGCPVCPHERDAHDLIADRFCTATAAGGYLRGCACAAGSRETRKRNHP
ncbi:RGCVC family protein [Amycolatopsis jejuensis]|uniref:RGCVC family protein n=1 Tax=Amycolatopsis jejuensis TaxID=330084 RepID=UPI0005270534|nr:RGCVC family protein [Amycolatopsis jejuensis]